MRWVFLLFAIGCASTDPVIDCSSLRVNCKIQPATVVVQRSVQDVRESRAIRRFYRENRERKLRERHYR